MKRTILSTLLAVFCSSIWAVTAQDISALPTQERLYNALLQK